MATDLVRLGQLILKANPYEAYAPPPPSGKAKMTPAEVTAHPEQVYLVSQDEGIEVDDYTGKWDFKNISYRIKRAIRIPYSYHDEKGVLFKDYLLIGYEGRGPG
jgi:hypothetical protein